MSIIYYVCLTILVCSRNIFCTTKIVGFKKMCIVSPPPKKIIHLHYKFSKFSLQTWICKSKLWKNHTIKHVFIQIDNIALNFTIVLLSVGTFVSCRTVPAQNNRIDYQKDAHVWHPTPTKNTRLLGSPPKCQSAINTFETN